MGKRPLPAGAPSHVHCEHLPAWALLQDGGSEVLEQAGPQCVFVGGLWWVWGGEQREECGLPVDSSFRVCGLGASGCSRTNVCVLSAWCWRAVWSVSGR